MVAVSLKKKTAGDWTLRTLYRGGSVDTAVTAERGAAVEAQVVVPD